MKHDSTLFYLMMGFLKISSRREITKNNEFVFNYFGRGGFYLTSTKCLFSTILTTNLDNYSSFPYCNRREIVNNVLNS